MSGAVDRCGTPRGYRLHHIAHEEVCQPCRDAWHDYETWYRASLPGRPLTAREVEVVALVAEGRSNGQIARRLGVTADGIKTHLYHVAIKLGRPGSRGGIVGEAYRRGILVLPVVAELRAENELLRAALADREPALRGL